jgi:hypothetical protein
LHFLKITASVTNYVSLLLIDTKLQKIKDNHYLTLLFHIKESQGLVVDGWVSKCNQLWPSLFSLCSYHQNVSLYPSVFKMIAVALAMV